MAGFVMARFLKRCARWKSLSRESFSWPPIPWRC